MEFDYHYRNIDNNKRKVFHALVLCGLIPSYFYYIPLFIYLYQHKIFSVENKPFFKYLCISHAISMKL